MTNLYYTPISIAELLDKITILQIKSNKILDKTKKNNVDKELNLLIKIIDYNKIKNNKNYLELYETNQLLWDSEDKIRQLEKENQFDNLFIETARSIYKLNDKRSQIKKNINTLYNSILIEEKFYN
jgi:DNA helicase HerA-like ATPase